MSADFPDQRSSKADRPTRLAAYFGEGERMGKRALQAMVMFIVGTVAHFVFTPFPLDSLSYVGNPDYWTSAAFNAAPLALVALWPAPGRLRAVVLVGVFAILLLVNYQMWGATRADAQGGLAVLAAAFLLSAVALAASMILWLGWGWARHTQTKRSSNP